MEPPEDLDALLREAPSWTLPPADWGKVDRALILMIESAGADDGDGMIRALRVLRRFGGRRVGRGVSENLDRTSEGEATAETRELIGEVVHRLGLEG